MVEPVDLGTAGALFDDRLPVGELLDIEVYGLAVGDVRLRHRSGLLELQVRRAQDHAHQAGLAVDDILDGLGLVGGHPREAQGLGRSAVGDTPVVVLEAEHVVIGEDADGLVELVDLNLALEDRVEEPV
ncbi:MAG: hypothetical protein WAR22_13435 [Desulfomonilia bacterium]